jgi:hypothetical protein
MPYLRGKLKGELKVNEIRKLIKLHNKLSKITIPVRSTRDQIIKIVNDSGYTIDHKNSKFKSNKGDKDLTLKEAQETFPVKKRVKKTVVKKAVILDKKPITIKKKEDEVRPAKIAAPPIPPNVQGKRIKVKIGKPSGRVKVGKLNVGKIDNTPAPKKPLGKVKTAVKKIDDSGKGTGLKPKAKKTPKKKEPKKKLEFLDELVDKGKYELEETGYRDKMGNRRCGDFVTVSKYIIEAEKNNFKKVRIFKLSDIDTDIRNVGSRNYANPTPLLILYTYFNRLIENKEFFIKIKDDCGVKELLFVEKAYKILLDKYDIIDKKITEQNKRYNPNISIKKLKDLEFNLTKNTEPKKEEPKKKNILFINENDEDVKADKKEKPPPRFPFEVPDKKKKKDDGKNEKLENELIDLSSEAEFVKKNIRDSPNYSVNKASAIESKIFEESDYKNYDTMNRAFMVLKKKAEGIEGGELVDISDSINDIKDTLAFIKDNIQGLN